jgi:two-component system sensor histidine kinase/response regulator
MSTNPDVDLPGRILVVDDLRPNRELVGDCMEQARHDVRMTSSADEARASMLDWMPDVILLDIMMPGVDGLQFCRQLKGSPATRAVPVILMTALNDRQLRFSGIEAGANDFLLKPLDRIEVVLRVRNALRSKRLYDGAMCAHEDLRRLEALREAMTHMLVHDLRSPLMGIGLCLEAIRQGAASGDHSLIAEDATACLRITGSLTEMIGTILDVSRLEAGAMPIEPSAGDVARILEDGIARVHGGSNASVRIDPAGFTVTWDQGLIARVVANLVGNALKHASGSPVLVRCLDQGAEVEIHVDDAGPGVPAEARERIFEKFGSLGTAEAKRHSTGLGLYFCKQVISGHRGTIGVAPRDPTGSRFWLRLPKHALPNASGTTRAAPPSR